MHEALSTVPEEIAAAWERARRFELANKYADIFGVVILGAGAAGAAAAMAGAVIAHTAQVPVTVVSGEILPAFVGPDNLVIACDTGDGAPETLAALDEVTQRGAKLVIVAPGEAWAAYAVANRAPLLAISAALPEPLMVGPLLVSLLATLGAAEVINGVRDMHVAAAVTVLRELRDTGITAGDDPITPNLARQVARQIAGRLLAIEGLGLLAPVAAWGRQRLAEYAHASVLSGEADNADLLAVSQSERAAVIALRSSFDPPLALAKARAAVEQRAGGKMPGAAIPAGGASRVAQTLWAAYFLDWVAQYLVADASGLMQSS